MDTTNIVTASFGASRLVRTRALYQWNYGQVLQFVGLDLPSAYTVHFSNQGVGGTAKTQVGNADGVDTPNEYLTTGQAVYAWVFLHTGADDGETMYSVIIPVTARPKPVEDEPTPVQQGVIDQAIAALNDAVEQTAADVEQTGADVETTAANVTAAQAAQTSAEAAYAAASVASDRAIIAETNAAQSASQAAQSATSAASNAAAATEARADAQTEAAAAAEYADNARNAAQDASDASETAIAAREGITEALDAAVAAQNNAEGYSDAASAKAGEAAQSATNAATSATGAATSATNAAQSASAAAGSASAAATSASNAAASEAAAREVEESIPADYSELSSEVGELKSHFEDITETYEPTNYGNADVDNLVIATSGLVGNVTATNNADGGVDIINSAGINGTVAFDLSALPYKQAKNLKFVVSIQNYKSAPSLDLRRSVSQGAIGAVVHNLTLDEQTGNYVYVWNDFKNYNYGSFGDIFLGYSLRYNQTTAVTITLTVTEVGDVEKLIISPDVIEGIGYDNLSDNFKASLSVVSGDKPTLYGGKQVSVFNKGVAIGDSLTAGVFNHNEGGGNAYSTITSFAYPAKLAQLTGIDVTNLGNGGYTSDQWWDAHKDDDLSGNQFAIIQLGVNDAIQYSSWTQTSITAFTNIINKILTENTGIFVFVSTIIPATSYMGASYDAVSEGIRDLVEDINDDHVILLDMAEYGNTADETGYNNGHLSALGYERLALDYISYISYMISQNPVLFRNIQFIGTNYRYD